MKKSELKALTLECKQELAEEATGNAWFDNIKVETIPVTTAYSLKGWTMDWAKALGKYLEDEGIAEYMLIGSPVFSVEYLIDGTVVGQYAKGDGSIEKSLYDILEGKAYEKI